MNIKRVWYNKKLVFSNKQNVWYVNGELKTYGPNGWAEAGTLQVYDGRWTNVPENGRLEYYDSMTPTYAGTSEDTLVATATFKNGDETLLEVSVKDGETPKYTGETPTKPADEENTYEFSGWDPELGPISKNTTYTAQFTATPIETPNS